VLADMITAETRRYVVADLASLRNRDSVTE
jgi:hypothetical protein